MSWQSPTFYDLMRNEFRFFIYVWGGFEYIWTIISENVKKCFIDTTCTLMFITSLNLQIQYSVLPSWVNAMIYIKMLQIIESIKHGQPSFIVNLIWLEKKKKRRFWIIKMTHKAMFMAQVIEYGRYYNEQDRLSKWMDFYLELRPWNKLMYIYI